MKGQILLIPLLSFILNIFLTGAKLILAFISGSHGLLAEGVHSLTDALGNLAVLAGIFLSEKKSPSFPWGLYKVENIAAFFSSILIFLAGYEIGKRALLGGEKPLSHLDITIIILFLLMLPILIFTRYERRKAKEFNSPALLADAQHWQTDLASMTIVGAGIAGSFFSFSFLDRIAAFIVLIFVFKVGYGILKDSMKSLLDASVDYQTLEKIREVIRSFPQIKQVKSLNARNSGRFIFVHLDLGLAIKEFEEAHELTEVIEQEIKKEILFVERISIHYEPVEKPTIKYAVPLADKEGKISMHFGDAPYLALWEARASDGKIVSSEILENSFITLEKGKGIKLAEFLIKRGVDIIFVKKGFEGRGPEYVFSSAHVEIKITDKKFFRELGI